MSQPKTPERARVTVRNLQDLTGSGALEPARPSEVAVEEPLEIRVASDLLATLMRTPGDDHLLVAGFLFTQGVIRGLSDLGKIAHCGRPTDQGYGNLVDVAPGPGTALEPERVFEQRGTIVTAAGGGGRQRSEKLSKQALQPVAGEWSVASLTLGAERLLAIQARAGVGLHAALALGGANPLEVLASAHDIGRHNAVDKVIGKLLFAELMTADKQNARLLVASGRADFDLVHKTWAARIGTLMVQETPTSLAIDTATALGITLICSHSAGRTELYTHPERMCGLV